MGILLYRLRLRASIYIAGTHTLQVVDYTARILFIKAVNRTREE